MSDKYNDHLKAILTADTRLVDEQGDLMLNKIKDLVNNLDENLLDILLADDESRDKFFIKIKEIHVFKQREFIFYLEQNSLDNSFTSYANRIGLTLNGKFLKDNTDVVLDFPYKDCVLEGGQSTEEGTDVYFKYDDKEEEYVEEKAKRKEIFYNTIIAKDEVDRLTEPKAFEKFEKFDKTGKIAFTKFERNSNGVINENLIIKGNNLLALYSLLKQYKGLLKVIYIDPPYNPPSDANTFTYNNNFNNSTWLTFMLNRLQVAKQLLKPDGCLIVAIDKNEHDYLGVLLRETFKDFATHSIAIVHNPRGAQGTNFSYTNEYAFFVFPKGLKIIGDTKIPQEEVDWSNLRNWGGESLRSDAKNCFYPIIVDTKTSKIVEFGDLSPDDFHPTSKNIKKGDLVEIYPIDSHGIERKWRYARQSVEGIREFLRARIKGKTWDVEIGKDFGQYKTVWQDTRYDANEYGTKIMKELAPDTNFKFPKSLWTVYDCLHAVVADDSEAIILDYHAGSGTSGHALMEMNKDGGKRKFIMVEQMDYVYDTTLERNKNAIKKYYPNETVVYLELAKNNQKAIELIQQAENFEELENMFSEIYEKYFLHYNVKIQEFKNKIIKEDNFLALPLERQKEIFIRMLDNNQLYVNVDDMEDTRYGLNPEDIRLTKDFYQINE